MFFLISELKDLADFLPAYLGTILKEFGKLYIKGTDWPIPAANLLNVEG